MYIMFGISPGFKVARRGLDIPVFGIPLQLRQ